MEQPSHFDYRNAVSGDLQYDSMLNLEAFHSERLVCEGELCPLLRIKHKQGQKGVLKKLRYLMLC